LNLTLDEVAARFRLTPDRFRKRRAALEAAGFPPPLPGFGRLLWNERQLQAWEDNPPPPVPAAEAPPGTGKPPTLPGSWGDELDARLERRSP